MEGYDETTYGEAFADVYDEWYESVSDVDATVATLARLARLAARAGAPARILELGVGTGRLAVPLARNHRDDVHVVGVDTSPAMLERLRHRDPDGVVHAIEADMVAGLPDGPFELVFIAYNTLFNLTADGDQEACFRAVSERLRDGGRFVVEAFVPDPPRDGDDISVRSMAADRIVLSITRQSASRPVVEGHFVELTERHGVRLRPWSIRSSTPEQLDAMAGAAGFALEGRWQDMSGTPFTTDSDRHVSVYRRSVAHPPHDRDASIV